MFGWLAAFGLCDSARFNTSATPWLPATPRRLAEWLPQLGGVLYLPGRQAPCDGLPGAAGILVESVELAPLLRVRALRGSSAVTPEGPREWIDGADAHGRVQMRLYLLPDTDYCAWDACLGGPARTCGGPAAPAAEPFRAAGARLLRFTHRRLGGLGLIGTAAPGLSGLGHRLAAGIARQEAVALQAALSG
ncbi:hypothetical protein C7456_105234 [Fulvimonas soli]|uniref:Uncharacterized protein n=1 Tax=Fulvimonas soli TaxID=155197 RepID=A0A316INK5_9GAMM|nr:hypothetical protein [Fulvimonas soli]PWK88700.1 hypothetical protein C7456_105234 [Fulvimonas soli]